VTLTLLNWPSKAVPLNAFASLVEPPVLLPVLLLLVAVLVAVSEGAFCPVVFLATASHALDIFNLFAVTYFAIFWQANIRLITVSSCTLRIFFSRS
jgi:hypothetical protein